MKYAYHDLYDHQFENLVVAICQELLGLGVQSFSTGPDGGRDAIFNGRATMFPSQTAPWQGKVVIQAKHTEAPFDKFSDTSFSGPAKTSVLSEELPRIKTLKSGGHLDFYMLFSNRRLGAGANAQIVKRIEVEASVANAHLVGVEALDLFLKRFSNVSTIAGISPIDIPLRVEPDDLCNVILALAENKDILKGSLAGITAIERTLFVDKNRINGLSSDYADLIKKGYIKYFVAIRNFLASPENEEILVAYQEVCVDFNSEIIANRHRYPTFDSVLDYLLKLLIGRDSDLKQNKRLTRALLYYMYWNCDLGKNDNAETDEVLTP
jgi:hypothetical protein